MWAIITDGNITETFNNPKGLILDGARYSKKIFSLWSKSEREAKGLYEVVLDNTNFKDQAYYINTNQSFAFADGVVTASYGSSTAKAHADTLFTSDDEDNGLGTEGEVKVEGLKTTRIRAVKSKAEDILKNTDWYIVRKADDGTAVPSAITTHRAAVRTKCSEMVTAITNAADTPAIETLYTYTKQEDNSVTRPLGELPRLEV